MTKLVLENLVELVTRRLVKTTQRAWLLFANSGSCLTALLIEGSCMTRMIMFSAPLFTLGLLSAPGAQAEDSMMRQDSMHLSKPVHHMKKDTMLKDDTAPK